MNEPLDQIDVMAREIEELRSCHDDLVAALEALFDNAKLFNRDSDADWVVLRDAVCAALKRAKEGE
jgi:hypothetical protein